MREKLKMLIELQKVDLEIASIRKSGDAFPRQLGDLDRELTAAKSALEAERQRLADLELQRKTLEQSTADEKEKVRKWEARLAEQRSSREYAALAREIDIAKKSNITLGEEAGELSKVIAQAREAVKLKEQEFAGRSDQIGGKMAEVKKKLAEVQEQAKALESRRSSAAASIDPNLFRRYEAVRKKRMPALVAVQAPGTCQGCNMNVPPQLYNTLRSQLGYDVCPSCHRIIFASEALDSGAR